MAFRFSLATLLQLREIAEQREERLLGQIQNQIAQSRQTLVDIERQRDVFIRQREQALAESISGVDLIDRYAQLRAIGNLEASAKEQLAKLTVLLNQQMKIYQAAHRNSEILCGMRDKQRESFYKQQIKQEQNAMDDNFTSRRNFS